MTEKERKNGTPEERGKRPGASLCPEDDGRILSVTAGPEDDGALFGTVVKNRLRVSRSMLSRLKFSGGLLLNGRETHTDVPVRAGDRVEAVLRDTKPVWDRLRPSEGSVNVLYEDEDLLIVDKPAPLPSIASARQQGDSLEARVFHYFGERDTFVYRPVNRLDKGTSGAMVIAKNAVSQGNLQKTLHSDSFVRTYLAVTDGIPAEREGVIDLPIGKETPQGVRRAVLPDGQRAQTAYRVLETGGGRALVALRLYTGRTHQIRVHLKAIGCPVTGDYLYGREHPQLAGRFALHSDAVKLIHPLSGRKVEAFSPLPAGLRALLEEE